MLVLRSDNLADDVGEVNNVGEVNENVGEVETPNPEVALHIFCHIR